MQPAVLALLFCVPHCVHNAISAIVMHIEESFLMVPEPSHSIFLQQHKYRQHTYVAVSHVLFSFFNNSFGLDQK